MGRCPARAPWRDRRGSLFSSLLATRPPNKKTAGRPYISGRSKLLPPARMCCVSGLQTQSDVAGSLTWQQPHSIQALQPEVLAAHKRIHQGPHPKPLSILQKLQTLRNFQSWKQKEKQPWKQQEGARLAHLPTWWPAIQTLLGGGESKMPPVSPSHTRVN